MDLSKGYWQVGLTERSKPLTAFETLRDLFQFRTTPFGLVNSRASFCRLMRIILSKLPNVDSFIDDMCIFTETWKDHMTSLRQVLDRLRSAKLTAKPSKCMIGYDSIECLCHNIVEQTVRPQEDKIQAIRVIRVIYKREICKNICLMLVWPVTSFMGNACSPGCRR